MRPMQRPFVLLLIVCLASPTAAVAQFRDPVFDDPLPPPSKPYQPPVQPAPFVPPPPAPTYQPGFPGPRVMAVPVGPARPVMGTVCVVAKTKTRPAQRCAAERAAVGTACRCDGDTGRVRAR